MTNLKVNDTITIGELRQINMTRTGDDKIKNQELKHLEYMLNQYGHDWFSKQDYSKKLGYEGMDQTIMGETLRGNMISNFNWYRTRLVKFGILETDNDGKAVSEVGRLKARIGELEAKLREYEDKQ